VVPSPSAAHEGIERDRDGGGDPEVDPLVGHGHAISVTQCHLALDREERVAAGIDEVEVERDEVEVGESTQQPRDLLASE